MRSFTLALVVLLLLASSPAAALHPPPSPEERLRNGAPLHVHVILTGSASASGSAEEDERDAEGFGSRFEDTHTAATRWDWTASGTFGTLTGEPGAVEILGNVSMSIRTTSHRDTTVHHGSTGTQSTTSDSVTECAREGALQGLGRASFTLEGEEIVLRFHSPGPPEGAPCTATLDETDTHAPARHRSEETNRFYDVAFSTKAEGDEIVLRVPIEGGKTIIMGDHDGALPTDNDGLSGQLCGRFVPRTDLVVACRATERIEVRLFVDICRAAAESAAQHRGELSAAAAAVPPSGTEAALLAWAADVAARTQSLLADERAHQLMGCTPPLEGSIAEVARALAAVRDALGKAAKEGRLTVDGERHLLGAERQLQIMGGPEATGDAAEGVQQVFSRAAGLTPSGAATVSVHSPVALRAVTLDGRVVGWNGSTNTTGSDVEGAASEGAPGGAQTLTLPGGVYFLEVVEQRYAPYLLALEGPDGEESHLVRALPGRVTRIPIAYVDDGDGPKLEVYAVQTAGAPGGGGEPSGTPEGTAPAPGLAVLPLVVAIAAVALVARLRRR